MKTRNQYKLVAILLSIILYTSCNKQYGEDALYISGTEEVSVKSLPVEVGLTTQIGLSITSSSLAAADMHIRMNTASSLVEEYNKKYGQRYTALPAEYYELSGNDVTIKSGTNVSSTVSLIIKPTATFKPGVSYMVPVTITQASSRVLESSRTIYYVLKPVIIASAVKLNGRAGFYTSAFANKTSVKNLTEFTYLARVNFAVTDNFLPTIMGEEERCLLRLNSTQLEKAGAGEVTSAPGLLSPNIWYQIALVKTASKMSLYIDGKLVMTNNDSKSYDLTIGAYGSPAGTFTVGMYDTRGDRGLNGMLQECSLWTKALTVPEMDNARCTIDPTSPGLEAYWKFNEGQGTIATDYTGHGYDLKAVGTINWESKIRCN
ncbi:BT_3987 domain-containing protein [Sphingobacterium spiritivorum]|uniref:BT_3987 domain-containing protein n=1 Tax=Sphingobacterium spiritivorum TaxID=258 RepID=UPI003DA3625C